MGYKDDFCQSTPPTTTQAQRRLPKKPVAASRSLVAAFESDSISPTKILDDSDQRSTSSHAVGHCIRYHNSVKRGLENPGATSGQTFLTNSPSAPAVVICHFKVNWFAVSHSEVSPSAAPAISPIPISTCWVSIDSNNLVWPNYLSMSYAIA